MNNIVWVVILIVLLGGAYYYSKKRRRGTSKVKDLVDVPTMDRGGPKVVKAIKIQEKEAKKVLPGGDNGAVEELPDGRGVIVTGDHPVAGRGKAETAVHTFKGNIEDATFDVADHFHRGKCYGVKWIAGRLLGWETRQGSMNKGLMWPEVVDMLAPDGPDTWNLWQIKGCNWAMNPSFVRGDTGNRTYTVAVRGYDGDHPKIKFATWNGGALVLS